MAYHDDVKTSTVAIVGFLGAILTFVVIVLMMVIYHRVANRLEEERTIQEPYAELENSLADQQARLVQYEKIGETEEDGKAKTVFRIPIQRAMQLELAAWRSGAEPGPPPERSAAEPEASAAGPETSGTEAGADEPPEQAPAEKSADAGPAAESDETGAEESAEEEKSDAD